MEIAKFIIPVLVTFLLNILFFWFIKRDVDRSIEEYKIVHSGVFKEKLDIYRELLNKSYRLKELLYYYHNSGDRKKYRPVFKIQIKAFIDYYLINQPFLSESMLNTLKEIQKEYQWVFDATDNYIYLENKEGVSYETKNKMLLKSAKAGNKLKADDPFSELETKIIDEMRADLKTENYKKEKFKKAS